MKAFQHVSRSAIQQRLQTAFWIAINVYAIGLIGYLLVRLLDIDRLWRFWPLALASNFIHYPLLAAIALMVITLIAKQWVSASLLAISAVSFVLLFGGLFLPSMNTSRCAESCHSLRVMTFNLGSDIAEAAPDRVEAVMRASGADVIGVQEVNAAHAVMFDTVLRDVYPYQVVYSAGNSVLGVALLSRYPITGEHPTHGYIEWLPYLMATVQAPTRDIVVMVAHPPPPELKRSVLHFYESRTVQDMHLFANLGETGIPSLLLADLNATDQSFEYSILAESDMRDAFREAGFGFGLTYPNNKPYGYTDLRTVPLVRIDYIWYTPHFEALRAWVGQDVGSDHLPVIADLGW